MTDKDNNKPANEQGEEQTVGSEGTGSTDVPTETEEKKTFTQDELDFIIKDRLKREREKYKDYADLKAAKTKLEEIEKAKLTDQEKVEARIKALEKVLEDKERTIVERDLRDLKRSKIDTLIADKKIKLPEGVTISDLLDMVTGQDEDGVDESLAKLTKFFPFSATVGAGSNPANQGRKDQSLDEKIAAALTEGQKTGNWNLYTQLSMRKQAENG